MNVPDNTLKSVDIATSDSSLIRVSDKEYRGESYVDVRLWVKCRQKGGELVPTPKGIIFNVEHLNTIIRALHSVRRSYNRRPKQSVSEPAASDPQTDNDLTFF